MSNSPALLVALARMRDRLRFADYVAAMPPLYSRFGGRYLAVSTASNVEQFGHSPTTQAVLISRWDSIESVLRFWNSPEYQVVTQLRAGTGDFIAVATVANADVEIAALPALAMILGPAPSPALFESGGAVALASARARDLQALEGEWIDGDLAIYGFPSLNLGRQMLLQLSSGQRGRSLLMPSIAPSVEMPCAVE